MFDILLDMLAQRSFEDLGTPTTGAPPTTGPSGGEDAPAEGTFVVAPGSQVGYRVPETLAGQDTEGVGRTSAVTGELVLDGAVVRTASFEVDMTTVTSDRSQRDGQFRNRIMNTAEYPTATFALTEPIELGELPPDLTEITVAATGDLTLRGVTRTVTFELTARRNGASLEVDGAIPVNFDDFEIPDASGGPAQVGRNGTIEVLLAFAPAP